MLQRFWWVCLSLGLMLSASACEKVDHCKEGDKGCFAGACLPDNKCLFGALECLKLDSDGSLVCGEARPDGSFRCGGAGACGPVDSGGEMPVVCECTGDSEVCVPGTSDQCLNFCVDPGPNYLPLTGRKMEILPCRLDSESTPVSYADACKATWKQICLRSPLFCGGFTCEPDFHNSAEAQTRCMADIGPDPEAVYAACEGVRDASCDTFPGCPGDEFALDCSDKESFVCANTCRFANDGVCDDGDLLTAAFPECDWGTDCGDCGPRVGSPQPARQPLGELCLEDKQCEGFSTDLRKNEAWCLDVDGVPDVFRCMPDCTRSKSCPEGYRCVGLRVDDEPITQGDLEAGVCNPTLCQ